MPELRWILIVFGLILLVAIYAWGRRGAKAVTADDDALPRSRPEPRFETGASYESSEFDSDPVQEEEELLRDEPVYEERPMTVPARGSAFAGTVVERESDEQTVEVAAQRSVREQRFARIEPTFSGESVTAELPAHEEEPLVPVSSMSKASSTSAPKPAQVEPETDAPTLSMSNTPPPRRIERRKIIALRLAAGPQRLSGAQLKDVFEAESLQHGKYDVFHRLDERGAPMFSVASMVEPGTFDLEKMPQETFPGITMFTQLPGPVAGMLAFNELLACSRRLHAALGGTLQDERGVPLTVHRVERIRQEIRDFELRPAAESQRPAYSSSPE